MKNFDIDYIEEPKLKFLSGESFNPCVGLLKFGPRFSSIDEKTHKWLKVGIIGSAQSIALTHKILNEMSLPSIPKRITKWSLPFPGLNEYSPLKFSLSYSPEWQQRISSAEIEEILIEKTHSKRTSKLIGIIASKIKILSEKSPPPDVIIVSLPRDLEEECKDAQSDKPLLKLENNDDFHNRIKLYGMDYKIPTQIIRADTLEFVGTQEKHTVFWNLAVGLLYKSQRGHPWKLAHLDDNTCYVGISFFKEKGGTNKLLRASMAQVFLDTGESFILRGEAFDVKTKNEEKNPHLSKENAMKLIEKVLEQYKIVRNILPQRIVIHKSSNYWVDELEGFKEASKTIPARDFVTIQPSDLKFYREGAYAVLRGTLISSPNYKEHYLYTTGFVPCINTFPGMGVPKPLLIRCFNQDSDIKKICEEILAFTKLDWNNTFIYRKEPVTISISRKVGWVLSETSAKQMSILDPHYYYYM